MNRRRCLVLALDLLIVHLALVMAALALLAPSWGAVAAWADAPGSGTAHLAVMARDAGSEVLGVSPWLLLLTGVCVALAHGRDRWLLPVLTCLGATVWTVAAVAGTVTWDGSHVLAGPGGGGVTALLVTPAVTVLALLGVARAGFRAAGPPPGATTVPGPTATRAATVVMALLVGTVCTVLTAAAVTGHVTREIEWGVTGDLLMTGGIAVALVAGACAASGHAVAGVLVAGAGLLHALPLVTQWTTLDTHSLVLAPLATALAMVAGWSHRPLRRAFDSLLAGQ
ncbi:hypothetical protein [Cellulomonas bogoriensis]|uniref:Uncharacterized protein n=1 Tax=Cellulomonas bogoriensis 69B4 = DSM 16987 TaxID=1386082 RepID=A0A0A0BZ51_9CELL|nr:hypothetical protein [Cellulomonas bogoriensis]KGM13210.1 hypothetical protein N869_15590 [Cellulomonas bogoriensis 69B4 = DSM 16987]